MLANALYLIPFSVLPFHFSLSKAGFRPSAPLFFSLLSWDCFTVFLKFFLCLLHCLTAFLLQLFELLNPKRDLYTASGSIDQGIILPLCKEPAEDFHHAMKLIPMGPPFSILLQDIVKIHDFTVEDKIFDHVSPLNSLVVK